MNVKQVGSMIVLRDFTPEQRKKTLNVLMNSDIHMSENVILVLDKYPERVLQLLRMNKLTG